MALRREGVFNPRPAYSLVAGNVSSIESGEYTAYIGILSAEQVRVISDDLERVSRSDVRTFCRYWLSRLIRNEGVVVA